MSSWSKTIKGKSVTIERAFNPLQLAMVRLGYEVAEVKDCKKVKLRKRQGVSNWAWHNHNTPHDVILTFKATTEGWFTKEHYLEVEVEFSDWALVVSDESVRVWQEIADKLQVMLSDPNVFLPLAPPGPLMPPFSNK
jgi:hypothetical protein